jgi:murein DD-endopeptidase MepM/ murein hydrolase activator NlpD
MIEIQIHPSDIRRKVRYLFFDRRSVVAFVATGGFLLLFVLGSMAVAPSVIRRVYKTTYLRFMREQRKEEREHLKQHVDQMTALERTLDGQRVRVEKLIAVYGLDNGTLGAGGFALPDTRNLDLTALDLSEAQRKEQQLRFSVQRLQEKLDQLSLFEQKNADLVRHIPSILPIPADQFVLTSPFGSRINPFTRVADFHKGLDLAAPSGTPVFATGDGIVTFAGRYPLRESVNWWRFGNVVVINHADRFITIYGHCDTVNVHSGEHVRQGQSIATVGSTGWSTNSHLHYEVRSDLERPGNFDPIDPRIYILNYQWNNEQKLLINARASRDYSNFDPLPSAFIGRRRV